MSLDLVLRLHLLDPMVLQLLSLFILISVFSHNAMSFQCEGHFYSASRNQIVFTGGNLPELSQIPDRQLKAKISLFTVKTLETLSDDFILEVEKARAEETPDLQPAATRAPVFTREEIHQYQMGEIHDSEVPFIFKSKELSARRIALDDLRGRLTINGAANPAAILQSRMEERIHQTLVKSDDELMRLFSVSKGEVTGIRSFLSLFELRQAELIFYLKVYIEVEQRQLEWARYDAKLLAESRRSSYEIRQKPIFPKGILLLSGLLIAPSTGLLGGGIGELILSLPGSGFIESIVTLSSVLWGPSLYRGLANLYSRGVVGPILKLRQRVKAIRIANVTNEYTTNTIEHLESLKIQLESKKTDYLGVSRRLQGVQTLIKSGNIGESVNAMSELHIYFNDFISDQALAPLHTWVREFQVLEKLRELQAEGQNQGFLSQSDVLKVRALIVFVKEQESRLVEILQLTEELKKAYVQYKEQFSEELSVEELDSIQQSFDFIEKFEANVEELRQLFLDQASSIEESFSPYLRRELGSQ